MPKKYLGIAGELVSGKTTASEYFVTQYNAEYLKFSQKVIDVILDILALPHTRFNEQEMGVLLKANYGADILMNALIKMSQKSKKNFFVFDGFRKPEEVALLKKQPNSYFIYIETPFELRYKRMTSRNEKIGEHHQTFEEFKVSQTHAADESIPDLKKLADFVIENTGSYEEFQTQLKEIGDKICL